MIFEDFPTFRAWIGEEFQLESFDPGLISNVTSHNSFARPDFVQDLLDSLHPHSSCGCMDFKDTSGAVTTAASTDDGGDIVIIGQRLTSSPYGGAGGATGGHNYTPRMPDEGTGGGSEETQDQNCQNTNRIEGTTPPDGATYYSPEGVADDYLIAALDHIGDIYANNPLNKVAVINEIISMYTSPTNPFFVDFKDWGTAAGPAGSLSGGTVTYYSPAAGTNVTGSAFEAFGNYFFGVLCTWGGLAPEEIWGAAAWYSESGPFWEGDDPQDVPHINNGIAAAQAFLAGSATPMFTVVITTCQEG